MKVGINYVLAIATLSDWLTNFTSGFQPMRSKTKTNSTLHARSFPRFEQAICNCRNSDWFTAMFAPVVICRR